MPSTTTRCCLLLSSDLPKSEVHGYPHENPVSKSVNLVYTCKLGWYHLRTLSPSLVVLLAHLGQHYKAELDPDAGLALQPNQSYRAQLVGLGASDHGQPHSVSPTIIPHKHVLHPRRI